MRTGESPNYFSTAVKSRRRLTFACHRLLGPAGIPKLRTRAQNLKIKGKGHEFSDAARLLSFYQLWLDDLFPKAKFLDALAMVEKAGHKKKLMTKRNEWINEAKPLSAGDREDNDDDANDVSGPGATIPAPPAAPTNTTTTQTERPKTPEAQAGDIPDDDDLYDATPRITGRTVPVVANNDEPDADDLDALMAEAESQDTTIQPAPKAAAPSEAVEDDLDGLIAEAETHDDGAQKSFNQGNGKQTEPSNHDFADDEAAMQEMDGLW